MESASLGTWWHMISYSWTQVRAEDGRFSVSVEAPEQLVKLGTSKDFGFCKARRKVCSLRWQHAL